LDWKDAAERRFSEYLEAITSVLGHADRRGPLRSCVTGLLLPGKCKSLEPMAARMAPQRLQAAHQSLHHFVANVGER
jgi:SRSO17 transposase